MRGAEDAAVMLVTGSTDGIGKETAARLAEVGTTVILHARSRERGEGVLRELRERTGSEGLGLVVGDLSSLAQVRGISEEVKVGYDRLDVLINNAGVVAEKRTETEDGYELTFAVNHLAPFLLTALLLETLKESAPCRVVTVSSELHERARMNFDDPGLAREWGPRKAYNQSKLANVMFAYELAGRLEGTGVTSNALHPGVVGTKLLRRGFGARGSSVSGAAEALVHLATNPEVEGVTGRYFRKDREADSSPASHDKEAQRKLWELSEEMVGLSQFRRI